MKSRLILLPGTLACLALIGCQGDKPRGGGTGDAPMTATGELAVANPKPMDAQGTFFASQVQVEAMLAKSDVEWKNSTAPDGTDRGSGRGSSGGSGTGFGVNGLGRRSGGRRSGGDTPSSSSSDTTPHAPPPRASNAPPVQLRLRLTNQGDQPVDVEVLDFNSELGNFAVQPPKITLPPHEAVEADPMTSRLGVPAVEEIPVTVRLRLGGKFGKTETQVLKLSPRPEDPPAPKSN